MPIAILALGVGLLLFLMLKLKLDGFVSLICVSLAVGLAMGMPLRETERDGETVPGVLDSIVAGVGGQVDDLMLILGFGAMLGVLMAEMGAAHRLAGTLLDKFSLKYAQLAIVLVAFLIGVVLFWETAWVILIPIVFALVRVTKVPLMWLAMPLAVALSAMHSFLPPHPGPTTVAGIFDASVGRTLLYGLVIALPIGAAVALTWPRLPFVKSVKGHIPPGLVAQKEFDKAELPSFGVSLALTALPIVLIAGAAIMELAVGPDAPGMAVVLFLGEAPIALLIGLLSALAYFSWGKKKPMAELIRVTGGAVKSIALIVFIIGAGGAFKQVLQDAGVSGYVGEAVSGWSLSPLILGWILAVAMRIALGSASVAVVAAAGIALPLVQAGGVSPELMVLAVASGSVAASHLNDPGFWMFKEFLGLSVTETLKVRTTYTSVLSVLGLGGTLLLSAFVPIA
ncbi:MAG: gluconate:H+ symporter [Bifidobacteriaceae bacterium]|jgi:Gnt-I system high-affinity gluconate transporter|nr:gluconate:H+ symporter [Bifidobacteriaceae bacterium]